MLYLLKQHYCFPEFYENKAFTALKYFNRHGHLAFYSLLFVKVPASVEQVTLRCHSFCFSEIELLRQNNPWLSAIAAEKRALESELQDVQSQLTGSKTTFKLCLNINVLVASQLSFKG